MWAWLSAHWGALVALLTSLGLFFFVKKGPQIVAPVPVVPPVNKKAEDQKNDNQKKAEDQHTQDVAVVVQQQQNQEKVLEDDPGAENDFIKRVGEDVRKP